MNDKAYLAGQDVAKYEIMEKIDDIMNIVKTIILGPNMAYDTNSRHNLTTRNKKNLEIDRFRFLAEQSKMNYSDTDEFKLGYSEIKQNKINKIKTAAEIFIEYIK